MSHELTPDIVGYGQRLWEHSRAFQRATILIGARIRTTIDRWRQTSGPTKRLRLLIAELDRDEAETASVRPGLIERLEIRLASTNDAQVREKILKCLSEP